MAVGIQSYHDSGMAQPLRDRLGVDPLLEHDASVSVAKRVERDTFNACTPNYLGECVGDRVGQKRGAVELREHKAVAGEC